MWPMYIPFFLWGLFGFKKKFIDTLPQGKTKDEREERERLILEAIKAGKAQFETSEITTNWKGHNAIITVMSQPIRIDNDFIPASHRTAQLAADFLDMRVLTPKIAREIWSQADFKIKPKTQEWYKDNSMGLTKRFKQYDKILKRAIKGAFGLIANLGKDWVTARRLFVERLGKVRSANFGWFRTSPWDPIQSVGLTHSLDHSDYSQLLRFQDRVLIVDGKMMEFDEVVTDPNLYGLVSDNILPQGRHPGIPLEVA